MEIFRKFSLPCSLVMGALGYLIFANVPFLVPIGDYCGPRLVSLMPVVLFSLLYVTFCKIEIKEMKPKAWHFILQLIRTSLALMMVVLIFEFGSDYSTKLILEVPSSASSVLRLPPWLWLRRSWAAVSVR